MTDREALETCYRLVAPLKDGRRERQITKLLEHHLGLKRCEELRRE